MRYRGSLLARLLPLLASGLLAPLMWPGIGLRLASWITPWGIHFLLSAVLFTLCVFALNRVLLDLYQEFINRE